MKKHLSLLCFAAFAMAFFSTLQAAEPEKVSLKFRYPEGHYDLLLKIDMTTETEINGSKITASQDQEQYLEITAGPIEADGTQKVVAEVKRIVMKQKSDFMDMSYDSDKKEDESSPLKAVGFMVGLKLTTVYDKNGNVTKIEGWDKFMEKLIEEAENDVQRQVFRMLKNQMSEESLMKMSSIGMEQMPKEPVAVGETWAIDISMPIPMLGEAKGKSENILKSIEMVEGKKIAEIVSEIILNTEKGTDPEAGPVKMNMENVEMTIDTVVKAEVETGLVFFSEAKTEMSMEMGGKATNADQEIKIPAMKITGGGTTTTTVRRRTGPPPAGLFLDR